MNWEAVIAVLTGVEVVRALVIYFLVAPLRSAGSRIMHLEKEISEAKLGDLREKLNEHRIKLEELDQVNTDYQLRTLPQFVSRADLEKSEVRRDNQLDAINDKLDACLLNDSQQATQLKSIEKQMATLFDLWNREHTKP